jgi:HK97 family phage prohead protease
MTTKIETRSFAMRAAGADDFSLEGIAASYDKESNDLGGFREVIAPGAFKRTLKESHDVKCLFNHDANVVLGRLKNGTLTLRDTRAGLAFRCQLDRNNTQHQNVYASVKRGDTDECSFAFNLPSKDSDSWDEVRDAKGVLKYMRRTLRDVNLFDVSVVTNPAYPQGTAVGARTAPAGDAWLAAAWVRVRAYEEQIDAENRRRLATNAALIAADKGK